MYRNKFEREVVQAVAERTRLDEKEVLMIYNSLWKALKIEMSKLTIRNIKFPMFGVMKISVDRINTLMKRIKKREKSIEWQIKNLLDPDDPEYDKKVEGLRGRVDHKTLAILKDNIKYKTWKTRHHS